MGYQEKINRGLDKAHGATDESPLDIENIRWVIFSDHHKGARDAADDFEECEQTYRGALVHYFSNAYTLAILGDCEELWECRPGMVMDTYAEVLVWEATFHSVGRYKRIFGNHDDDWSFPGLVQTHLGRFFGDLTVHESMRIRIVDEGETLGEIFLVHGHQGTTFGDKLGWLSRIAVRYVWRPLQRLTGIKTATPSTDWRLRHKHDIAMYNWAVSQKRVVLIAGHTHHPIFPSTERADRLAAQCAELERLGTPTEELEIAKADLAFARVQVQPCYLNSGCCSFSDGSITGIEIDAGEIRIVRWTLVSGTPSREVLDSASLRHIFEEVTDVGAHMRVPSYAK
jgi:hypothetical protein